MKAELFFLIQNQVSPSTNKYMLNKYFTNIDLKARQIINLPGTPTYLGPALAVALDP
jgi:hypothetical protein